MEKENKLILYKDEEGKVCVNVRFADEDVWLTNNLIAEIYATTRQDIDYHITNIYADGELMKEATCKNYLQVRKRVREKFNATCLIIISMSSLQLAIV